jgi:hypothetical protein
MTDLEKFIDTYKQFGIEVKTYENEGNIEIMLGGFHDETTKSDKFIGSMFNSLLEFHSTLRFTKEGKFIHQGFWDN